MTAFQINAIDQDVLAEVRSSGVDRLGGTSESVTAGGGEPARCCLSNAAEGDELLLFCYEPVLPPSPYREIGAVYVHADQSRCVPVVAGYPADWRGRPQILRAYDARGWIQDAKVHDGSDPESVIAELFGDPAVVQLHSRNVGYGCFMFSATRP